VGNIGNKLFPHFINFAFFFYIVLQFQVGCLVFEFEKCIACGLCVRSCPNNVLSMEIAKGMKILKKIS